MSELSVKPDLCLETITEELTEHGCCCSLAYLAEQVRSPEEKQTVSQGTPQVYWAAYLMLCSNVRDSGS